MVRSRKIFSIWSHPQNKMCKITKCCRCFGVRPGAYLIAILSVFRGIVFLIWFGYGILNGNWFLEDVIYKNIKSSLIELDQDISFTPHAYISYCVCAVTILFIINDFVLLMGLKKNHPILMLIWLLIGGINRTVSKLFDSFDVKNKDLYQVYITNLDVLLSHLKWTVDV